MNTIIHTVHIHAAPDAVYRALTSERGLTGWWTTRASVEEGEGGMIRFTFRDDFHPQMRQTRLEHGEVVEWECVDGHDNWQDNRFSFLFRDRNGETSLRFVQHYARELDDDTYGTYNFNWGYYLNSLKALCENGAGFPYEPTE
jgi:uncharacterized protein YndB with AHSA1/START domain